MKPLPEEVRALGREYAAENDAIRHARDLRLVNKMVPLRCIPTFDDVIHILRERSSRTTEEERQHELR